MILEITEREQWFRDRVGKVVYRNKTSCDCEICNSVYKNGLFIKDIFHAEYIAMCECDYNSECVPLYYFDTKKERNQYEKRIKNTTFNETPEDTLKFLKHIENGKR